MKTGLGLNFLRIVNEEGFDGWAQVYARIPFDESEIQTKGALFGAIYSENLTEWTNKEAEIMTWMDEYFNQDENTGDLVKIENYLQGSYPGLSCVWIWVSLTADGKREIKIVKSGEVGIWLLRKEEKIDFGKLLADEKVLKGSILNGDKLVIWAGQMTRMFETVDEIDTQDTVVKIGDELMKANKSGASLIFTFESIESAESIEATDAGIMNVETETKNEVETVKDQQVEPVSKDNGSYRINYSEKFEPQKTTVEDERTELVTDRYVGKVGPKEKLINWWKNRTSRRRNDISVGRPIAKRKRMAMGLGLLFLVLLVVSIVSGSIKIKADMEQKKWSQFYEPIEKKRLDAVGLASINLVGSRKLLEEVKVTFDAGKGQFVNTKFKVQLADLENKINSSWATAAGEKQSSLDTQVDIGLIRSGFLGKRLSLITDSNFLVLDDKMGLVVSTNGTTKEIKVLAGKGESLGWTDVLFDGKRNILLDGTGVSVVETGKRIATFDAAVSKPIALGVFGTNVYVLDQGNKEIYRYNSTSDQLGDRNRWLKQGQVVTSTPLDMAIDGDIWVLEQGNNLEKFRRGSKENFSLNSVPDKTNFSKVAVSVSGSAIALLDSGNGAISIFKKEDGGFVQQLKMDSLKEATDIEYDVKGNLWVLIKGVVGSIK